MEKRYETATPPGLDLRVPSGRIEVETGAVGVTELRLDGPEDMLGTIRVEQHGATIVVDAEDWRKWLPWNNGDQGLRLHVGCPDGASLGARTKSADVRVTGVLARAEVATASGEVELDVVTGDVVFRSASGDATVREVGGDLRVDTASGDCRADRVAGSVRVNGVSGDLRVGSVGADATVSTVSGDVELAAVTAGRVSVQSVSGDASIGVGRGSAVHVDASSLSGDLSSELDLGGEEPAGEGPFVELRVKSVSGDVAVRRAAAAAVA